MRDRRTARIDAQDGGDDRIEALRLKRIARVRSAAIAEAMIAAAGVEQAIVGMAGLCRGVELDRAHRMGEGGDDVWFTQDLAPRALESIGRRVRRVPLGNDV